MTPHAPRKLLRCALYTRKSTERNLDLEFNSLDAQREACEAYIKSQAHEGWRLVRTRYDDGGLSGAALERPARQGLLGDVRDGKIDVIVVYKVDRPTARHPRPAAVPPVTGLPIFAARCDNFATITGALPDTVFSLARPRFHGAFSLTGDAA
jgi:hypothetical protein